jgi:hypothetical protein
LVVLSSVEETVECETGILQAAALKQRISLYSDEESTQLFA